MSTIQIPSELTVEDLLSVVNNYRRLSYANSRSNFQSSKNKMEKRRKKH